MAVALAATLLRQNLVQISELDPSAQLVFTGGLTGDGSGGLNVITATCPTDLGWYVVGVSCEIGQSSTSNIHYRVTMGGRSIFRAGAAAVLANTINVPEIQDPPRIVMAEHPMTINCSSVNTNLEIMNITFIAFGWELQIARNLPMKFFWPGTLA